MSVTPPTTEQRAKHIERVIRGTLGTYEAAAQALDYLEELLALARLTADMADTLDAYLTNGYQGKSLSECRNEMRDLLARFHALGDTS